MGIRDPDCRKEFGSRRNAAKKMIAWSDGWVVDPGIRHAELLGCDRSGYNFDNFDKALNRLAEAETIDDVQAVENLLRMDFGRKHRDQTYGQFSDKMKKAVAGYDTACVELGIDLKDKAKPTVINQVFETCKLLHTVVKAEFSRAVELVRLYSEDDEFRTSLTGFPDVSQADCLIPYSMVYLENLKRYIQGANIEDNDFGDLQFAIYGCTGNTLLTCEKKWVTISTIVNSFSALRR